MKYSRRVAALLAVIVMLAACSGDTAGDDETPDETADETADETTVDDGGAPVSVEADDLDGTSWTLMFGGGPEGPFDMIDGWPVTLTFNGFNFSGTAACNGYGASYLLEGSSFQVTELGWEDAGCESAVAEVQDLYFAALEDVDGINLAGDELALSGPATELIFRRNTPAPMDELVATLWLLEEVVQNGVATSVTGDPATLDVQSGGKLTGATGCRMLDGTFVVSGNEILLNNFSASGNCPTSLWAQDSAVVTVLGDGFVPEVNGDELILTSAGDQGLRYRATTPDEVAALPVSTAPTDAELLDGIEWVFTGGDTPDGLIADPRSLGDQQITFVVSNGEFSGMVNCNSYGGQVEIGSGQWNLTEPDATEEGCGRELDAIAARYLDGLPLMTEFGIEGNTNRLTTNGSDIELNFERAR